jgi:opacity protein-like surface antigen
VYGIYGRGRANVSATFSYNATTNINLPTTVTTLAGSSSVSGSVSGNAYGFGVEYAVPTLRGVKIRAQYLQTNFGDMNFITNIPVAVCTGGGCTGGFTPNTVSGPTLKQFTVGVTYSPF